MHIIPKSPSDRQPGAIAPLSVLPVFLNLRGKKAVVAGGTDAAAWKAELLAASGAEILVYASPQSLGERFRDLLESPRYDGRISYGGRSWSADTLADAALLVAEARTDDEAASLRAVAKRAGVPINVIDRPAFCDFQFGSIVNRSPVVVGISTGGAAPVLAQAIRRKIETLLPPSVAAWADLARRIRSLINQRIAPGLRRRVFWERFVDRSFGPPPTSASESELADDLSHIGQADAYSVGHVTLVGAGPGDAELLTLKAVRALQAADIILFDDLISDGVLELARREAKRILVGKRAGRPSCMQDDICDLMVKLARQGKHVVRLKGGDPMIFGRAGEEIARLDAEAIPFDVVPGITAGLALAATLGLSLTHRNFAKSVRFVTGHSHRGGLPHDLDWQAVADPSTTTVFYMAGRTCAEIARRLAALGMSADTPVVVASALSRPEQNLWHGDLAGLSAQPAATGPAAPVIVGIGGAFAARGRTASVPSHSDNGHNGDVGVASSRAFS